MARNVIYDAGGVLSTINGLLKEDYVQNEITDAVNKATVFLSRLRSEKSTHGRKFVFPVQLGVSQGTGARSENENLPSSGFGEYEQAFGNVKYLYSSVYITGQSIEATTGGAAAFADVLKRALSDCRESLKLDMQRQVWGDGTGIIGRVGAGGVNGSTTVPVDAPFGLTYTGPLDDSQKTRLFKRNMGIFIDASTDQFAVVTAINSNGTITVGTAVTAAANDPIYRGDSTSLHSKDKEVTGLTGVVSATGTYLGINRSGIPEWQSNVLAVAGGQLTEDAMRIAMDQSLINGNAEPDLIITDIKTRRLYESLLTSLKRFVNPMQLEGGFTALEYDGKPVVVDKDAPPERMWFLNTKDFSWMVMADFKFMDRDGAVLHRAPGKDAYEAVFYAYKELVCKRPANQTVLTGITTVPA